MKRGAAGQSRVVVKQKHGGLLRWSGRHAPGTAGEVPASPPMPTVFIECTQTWRNDANTGIQRVVRNLLRSGGAPAAAHGCALAPVAFDAGGFYRMELAAVLAPAAHEPSEPPSAHHARRALAQRLWRGLLRVLLAVFPFAAAERFILAPPDQVGLAWCLILPLRILRLRPWPQDDPARQALVRLDAYADCRGSVLLLLDASWSLPIWPAVERFRRSGGRVVGVIHDLIPLTHPHTCEPRLTRAFRSWLTAHLTLSDGFICVSRATADALRRYALAHPGPRSAAVPPIAHFHLASELDLAGTGAPARPAIVALFAAPEPTFLMVGTFEPRKRHAFVLDAFDLHWRQGGRARLVLIGRQAWKTEAFLHRVAAHPEYGRRLFLIRDAGDTDLAHAYGHAAALIIASEIEGFGLPVVEAFQYGLPVLCSDIPVFREIAGDRAAYFSLTDPATLTALLAGVGPGESEGRRTPQPWITWTESADQLFAAMADALRGKGG
ncbi:MAG: glycosyltransferase family 1 protein [Acetobacteraceae bacterium]